MECVHCNKEIPKVFPDSENVDFQLEDALVLTIHGGYGMYFDFMEKCFGGPGDITLALCKTCATLFLTQFSNIQKACHEHQ